MTTTIGRVEFIVGLDGNQLPAQARRIANQMQKAGTKAGDGFSDGFDASFEKRLSTIGERIAGKMSKDGRLAGESFSNSFGGALTGRFQKIQTNLADILSDGDAFAAYASGFDSVDEAVRQVETDLGRLRQETYKYTDDQGKVHDRVVLTAQGFRDFSAEARRLGAELKISNKSAQDFEASSRLMAVELERVTGQYERLGRLTGDTDAFRQMSIQVGDVDEAFSRLSTEIEGAGRALGRSEGEIHNFIDSLDRTRDAVNNQNAEMARLEREASRVDAAFRKLGHSISNPWRNLDNDVRLVIGLVASAADQIAVLGSALGAGAVALGTTFTAAILGVGAAIPVFIDLNRSIEDLPESMQEVAKEFTVFKNAFADTGRVISSSAFEELDGTFLSFTTTLRGLDPVLSKLGGAVGRVMDDLADGLAPGTQGFEDLSDLIDESAGLFEDLAGAAGVWGGALVKSFGRATPLAEDFVGWIELLGTRFDNFARSSAFDDWITNAQRTFGSFGNLLDAVGRGLNDLATPEAVDRTTALLDNLAEFTPELTSMLNVIGQLDPLGLVAQALNDIGTALGPLSGPLGNLAEQLNRIVSISIEQFAKGLEVVATVAGPAIDTVAGALEKIDDDTMRGIANGILVLAGAFVVFKGAAGIAGAAGLIGDMSARLDTFTGKLGPAGSKVGAFARTLGVIGAAAGGALLVTSAVEQLTDSIVDLDGKARTLVGGNASLKDSFNELNGVAEGLDEPIKDWDAALSALDDVGNPFLNLSAAMNDTGRDALALSGTLKALDPVLAKLPLADATAQFSDWAAEVGASDEQVLMMIEKMPGFQAALEGAATAAGSAGSSQDILTLALGGSLGAVDDNAAALAELEGKSGTAGGAIDGLAEKIRLFGDATLTTREAERQFQQAIDDVTASVAENGTGLDINTEQGRNNQAALDDIAQSALEFAAATYEETGKIEGATGAVQAGRDALIEQAKQFGLTQDEAEDYADELGLIPEDVDTLVALLGVDGAEAALDNLTRARTVNIFAAVVPARIDPFSGTLPQTAVGGTFSGAQARVIAEAGPEAVVPLNRPLNQVDPSVRMLSAFAQGKLNPELYGSGGGTQNVIAAGAIVVNDARNADAVAVGVLTRVAEMLS